MSKLILTGIEARQKLKAGIDKVASCVKITLGPKGKNVVLDRKYTTPLITNDGVTIAKEIELDDPFENIGANLIKEVSIKTNDSAGDGTTTACVLASAIIDEGLKNIASGANPISLRKGIDIAVNTVINELKTISKPVSSDQEIAQVAAISAGDQEIGNLICDAFKKVGRDGVITIEESKTSQTNLRVVQGLEFDRGYISPYMVSQNSNIATLENAYILVTDKKLTNLADLLPLFEKIMETRKPLLIIAEDVDGEVLSTLALNNIRGSFISVAVKCPSFGEKQKEYLEDICLLTGATFISNQLYSNLKDISLEHLGEATKIKVTKDKTTIVGGAAKTEEIEFKREQLHEMLSCELDTYDKVKIEDRLARLSGGVAIIEVGAPSEVEMKEKKLRIEDALSATKAATQEGIVAGGGCALIMCENKLNEIIENYDGDTQTGIKIIKKAIQAPLRQISKNSEQDDGVVVTNVQAKIKENIGFNALKCSYENMYNAGIIDPTKVTRCAILNAGSVASTILTTEVIVAESPEKQ